MGVNLIRLGVMWPGVMPHKDHVDKGYLDRVLKIIRMCSDNGIYTIVEPHQDEFNERFCGEGAPDWFADQFTQVTDFPVPVQSKPFPTSGKAAVPVPTKKECHSHSSFSYIWTHFLVLPRRNALCMLFYILALLF